MSGGKILDQIEITLRDATKQHYHTVWIEVNDNSLSRKWLAALNHLLEYNFHLEKNYCFLGFVDHVRNGWYILDQINQTIDHVCEFARSHGIILFHLDKFTMQNTLSDQPESGRTVGRNIIQHKLNQLHRLFELCQGTHHAPGVLYQRADPETRWYIRQLNLLCHEFESWALSYRKDIEAPEWKRPSQLMCWLQAPRYELDDEDFALFGIETLNRPLGGVYVGVNKAVGKHHWEVFCDEGNESRIAELQTTVLSSQYLAAGDFDIEWGRNPKQFSWQQQRLKDFKKWLVANGFNPDDPRLTIGHPQVAKVDVERSFGTSDVETVWKILSQHLDVYRIKTTEQQAIYDYCWSDDNYRLTQIEIISKNMVHRSLKNKEQ